MRVARITKQSLRDWAGHAAVAALLTAVFWASYGCGPGDGDRDGSAGGTAAGEPAVPIRPVSNPTPPTGTGVPDETREVVETRRVVAYGEAEAAYLERRYGDAVDLFTVYTESKPDNPWGFYMLGLAAWKAGDHVTSEEAFERALERDPGHVKSLLNLSRVLLETGRAGDALVRIEEALGVGPESGDAFRLQGRALSELGRSDEAIEAYGEAILLNDQDAWSMNNLGLLLIQDGRHEEALQPLARAVQIDSTIAVFHNNLGIALEVTGHHEQATQAYRRALELDGSYEKASVNLSRVEQLEPKPGVEPVDLEMLAEEFVAQIGRWRESPDSTTVPEVEN
jgi:Flp pilus assembly protein TadD